MPNIEITNCDVAQIEIADGRFRDELLVFAAADTFVKGTILARRAVATAVTASAVTGAGNGTCTAASVIAGERIPLVGAYVLRCITAVADGGVFRLEDPNGQIVAAYLAMTAGAGAATTFKAAGMQFTLTDGSNNFAAGDTFTLTVAADGKLVPFDPAGVGGAQVPMAVLTYEASKSGSGNLAIRALVAGRVNATRLVIDAGGSITDIILDQLRARGIVASSVEQLSALDNQ